MDDPLTEAEFEVFAKRLLWTIEKKTKQQAAEGNFTVLGDLTRLRSEWQQLWFGGSKPNLRSLLFPQPYPRTPKH